MKSGGRLGGWGWGRGAAGAGAGRRCKKCEIMWDFEQSFGGKIKLNGLSAQYYITLSAHQYYDKVESR